jgi:heterodisulfide reductase subunit A2
LAEKKAAAKKAAAGLSSPKTGKKKAVAKRPAKTSTVKKAPEAAPAKQVEPAIEPIDASGEPRVGVFVCHCGTNIAGFLDVADVTEYAATLPNVVFATRNLYTCAEDGISAIKDAIREHNLNRVVVASCTPRTHEPLFRAACEEAGLNKYLFEFANIRDQCSWVHMHEWDEATAKARDLVRMSVMRASLLEPLEEISIDIHPASLVIGAGIAGMTAALSVASQGYEVFLVEKEAEVGGMLRNPDNLTPTSTNPQTVIM